MSDITDMILEGILDEETGEYIGDYNRLVYGTEAPGFLVSLHREGKKPVKKVACPTCGRKVKPLGLQQHTQDKHKDLCQ